MAMKMGRQEWSNRAGRPTVTAADFMISRLTLIPASVASSLMPPS